MTRRLPIVLLCMQLVSACAAKANPDMAKGELSSVAAEPTTTPVPTPVVTPGPQPAKAVVAAIVAPMAVDVRTPIGVIRSYEVEIRGIISKYEGKKSAKQIAERDRLLGKQVRKFFDFEELARLTLQKHWSKLSAAERQRFTDIFIKLIERTYLNKTREMIAEYEVIYDDQQLGKNSAKVNSRIKKNDVDVKVAYELKQQKNGKNVGWVIYNVIFDNLDLLSNYRSQFNRIIAQKSFAELIRVMEDRLKNPAETVKL